MISLDLGECLLLEFKTLFVAALLAFLTWDAFWLNALYTRHLALCFLICYFICVMVDSQPPHFIQPPPNYTNFHNMVEREQFLCAAFAADERGFPPHIVVHDCGSADIYAYVEQPRADHNATDAEHRRYSIPEIEELFGVLLAQIQTTGQDMPVPPYPGRRHSDTSGEDEDGCGQSGPSA